MKNITFIGKSGEIFIPRNKGIVINKYNVQPYPPTIHFMSTNGNKELRPVELNKIYDIADYDFIYFTSNAECTLTYELID